VIRGGTSTALIFACGFACQEFPAAAVATEIEPIPVALGGQGCSFVNGHLADRVNRHLCSCLLDGEAAAESGEPLAANCVLGEESILADRIIGARGNPGSQEVS
jgi:hypothetical protein